MIDKLLRSTAKSFAEIFKQFKYRIFVVGRVHFLSVILSFIILTSKYRNRETKKTVLN